MQMGVQRKWMYLESIFVGSEDIRKQVINDYVAIRSAFTPPQLAGEIVHEFRSLCIFSDAYMRVCT